MDNLDINIDYDEAVVIEIPGEKNLKKIKLGTGSGKFNNLSFYPKSPKSSNSSNTITNPLKNKINKVIILNKILFPKQGISYIKVSGRNNYQKFEKMIDSSKCIKRKKLILDCNHFIAVCPPYNRQFAHSKRDYPILNIIIIDWLLKKRNIKDPIIFIDPMTRYTPEYRGVDLSELRRNMFLLKNTIKETKSNVKLILSFRSSLLRKFNIKKLHPVFFNKLNEYKLINISLDMGIYQTGGHYKSDFANYSKNINKIIKSLIKYSYAEELYIVPDNFTGYAICLPSIINGLFNNLDPSNKKKIYILHKRIETYIPLQLI